MTFLPMKTFSCLLALALAWSFSPSSARSGDAGVLVTTPAFSGTVFGKFWLDDGQTLTTGKYEQTHLSSGSTESDTIVYTDAATGATRTDSTVTTINADFSSPVASTTVVYTHTDFGATASYTATTTFPVRFATAIPPVTLQPGFFSIPAGQASYGTGTFTAADGSTGTLTTFATGSVTSTDRNSTTTGLTRVLSVKAVDGRRVTETTNTVGADGVLTTVTLIRKTAVIHP